MYLHAKHIFQRVHVDQHLASPKIRLQARFEALVVEKSKVAKENADMLE